MNKTDLDTQPGNDSLQIINETYRWSESFYDENIDDVKEKILRNSGNGIVYIEYQYPQLGKDEEWFKKTCQTVLNNPLKIKREIFLQRMRGSSQSPFEPEVLEAINELKGKIKEEFYINKLYRLDVYEPIRRDRVYLVGVDVSNGYGEDNSAVTIIDPYSLKPVAEFASPYISVSALSKFLISLVKKHVPRAILAIERNANGEAVMDLIRNSEIRHTLYFDNTKDLVGGGIDDKVDTQGFLKREAARRKLYGVWTGGKSRETMFSILDAHVNDFKDKFITNNIINDLYQLVRTKRGRIEAGSGFHDDSLMSYLVALYVYYHGNNLHRFGFVRGELPDDDERNKGMSYKELQEHLPSEIQDAFKNVGFSTMEDYNQKLVDEIQRARKESAQMNKILNPINIAENYEDDFNDDYEMDLGFFDDLND